MVTPFGLIPAKAKHMTDIINLMNAASARLSKDVLFNDKSQTILAILRAKQVLKPLRCNQNGALHLSFAAAFVLACKNRTPVSVNNRGAQALFNRGGSTRLIPFLDDMVSKGLLITQSSLQRAEGALQLGPLLKQYL
jgi:hypothetical protein